MSLPSPNSQDTILITGASAGIGTELARQLAARGHGLTLVARRRERLEELAEELRGTHGTEVEVHDRDLADEAGRAELIDTLRQGPKHVAGVCNNAGYGTFGRFSDLPREGETNMVRLNCLALVDLTHAFLSPMVERGEGAILEVGSMAGFQPTPWNSTYAATKAFVLSFSEGVSAELAGTGVSLTILCPGPVNTEFSEVAGVAELHSGLPDFLTQSSEEVARAGIAGMVRGKRTVFTGMSHRVVAQAGRFTPRTALLPVMNKIGTRTLEHR
jgi:short-subunit dehydrogenase